MAHEALREAGKRLGGQTRELSANRVAIPVNNLRSKLMRDYDNMPVLDWRDDKVPQKAKAQILHQEPVILQMPDDFDIALDGAAFDCEPHQEAGILFDCGGKVLSRLAERNQLPSLNIIAEACVESSSRVDIDTAHKRLIVHD